ncbi:MAG TPA: NUDIX domain-containing protein [Patescibacteria group bacterium]|nr:NUDIX domain-containing protein [Patescibacteria group bacterium]
MSSKERFKLIPAVFLILRRDNEILLLRRANTGYQDGKYSVVAGHLDGDELATHALAREAKEEASIEIDPNKLKLVPTSHRLTRNEPGQERVDLFFEAPDWKGTIAIGEPTKCDDLSWHPVNNLPNNMLPHVKIILDNIEKGLSYSEFTEEPV